MLKTTQLQRSRERLVRLCQAELEVDELRLEIVAELKHAFGFAFWCWPLVDPVSLIPACALSEHEPMPRVFGRYMTLMECGPEDINGYQTLARSRSAVGLLHQATAGDPQRSVRGRELYLPLGCATSCAPSCATAAAAGATSTCSAKWATRHSIPSLADSSPSWYPPWRSIASTDSPWGTNSR